MTLSTDLHGLVLFSILLFVGLLLHDAWVGGTLYVDNSALLFQYLRILQRRISALCDQKMNPMSVAFWVLQLAWALIYWDLRRLETELAEGKRCLKKYYWRDRRQCLTALRERYEPVIGQARFFQDLISKREADLNRAEKDMKKLERDIDKLIFDQMRSLRANRNPNWMYLTALCYANSADPIGDSLMSRNELGMLTASRNSEMQNSDFQQVARIRNVRRSHIRRHRSERSTPQLNLARFRTEVLHETSTATDAIEALMTLEQFRQRNKERTRSKYIRKTAKHGSCCANLQPAQPIIHANKLTQKLTTENSVSSQHTFGDPKTFEKLIHPSSSIPKTEDSQENTHYLKISKSSIDNLFSYNEPAGNTVDERFSFQLASTNSTISKKTSEETINDESPFDYADIELSNIIWKPENLLLNPFGTTEEREEIIEGENITDILQEERIEDIELENNTSDDETDDISDSESQNILQKESSGKISSEGHQSISSLAFDICSTLPEKTSSLKDNVFSNNTKYESFVDISGDDPTVTCQESGSIKRNYAMTFTYPRSKSETNADIPRIPMLRRFQKNSSLDSVMPSYIPIPKSRIFTCENSPVQNIDEGSLKDTRTDLEQIMPRPKIRKILNTSPRTEGKLEDVEKKSSSLTWETVQELEEPFSLERQSEILLTEGSATLDFSTQLILLSDSTGAISPSPVGVLTGSEIRSDINISEIELDFIQECSKHSQQDKLDGDKTDIPPKLTRVEEMKQKFLNSLNQDSSKIDEAKNNSSYEKPSKNEGKKINFDGLFGDFSTGQRKELVVLWEEKNGSPSKEKKSGKE